MVLYLSRQSFLHPNTSSFWFNKFFQHDTAVAYNKLNSLYNTYIMSKPFSTGSLNSSISSISPYRMLCSFSFQYTPIFYSKDLKRPPLHYTRVSIMSFKNHNLHHYFSSSPSSQDTKIPLRLLKSKQSQKRPLRKLLILIGTCSLLTGLFGSFYLSPPPTTKRKKNIYSSTLLTQPSSMVSRIKNKLSLMGKTTERYLECINDFLQDALDMYFPLSNTPLLPDPIDLKHPENFPTLVVDMDKVLIKMEHDRLHGWRPLMRPGAEQFFKELVYHYEIVVWSDDNFPVAQDICMKWGLPVVGALHRDNCKRRKGHYVKDLNRLGRRLERLLILDHDPYAFLLQPNNGILIREFNGNPADKELYAATEFLKAAALSPYSDIRDFVSNYGAHDEGLLERWTAQRSLQEQKSESRRHLGSKIFTHRSSTPLKKP